MSADGAMAGSPTPQRIALLLVAVTLVLAGLLFAGTAYTKTEAVSVLTFYDLSLLVLAALSLGARRALFDEPYFVLMMAVVAVYAAGSLLTHAGFLTIRQAAMFGYALIGALIVSTAADAGALAVLLRIVRRIAYLSIAAQLLWGLEVVATGGSFGDEQYHYLSPAAVVLNLVGLGFFLAHRSRIVQTVGTAAAFACLYMSGHSTAILAGLVVVALPVFRVLPTRARVLALAGALASVLAAIAFFVTEGSRSIDVNALWRFFYWASISKEILIDNFGVVGNGFGTPYASDATAFLLQVEQGFTTTLGEGDESYLSPPHNFLLTIAFHLGFLPACVYYAATFLLVHRLALQRVVQGRFARDSVALGQAVAGMTAWASFNVIIELPHASLVYWLVFFIGLRLLRAARPVPQGAAPGRRGWRDLVFRPALAERRSAEARGPA